jgi:hypothetical protein
MAMQRAGTPAGDAPKARICFVTGGCRSGTRRASLPATSPLGPFQTSMSLDVYAHVVSPDDDEWT